MRRLSFVVFCFVCGSDTVIRAPFRPLQGLWSTLTAFGAPLFSIRSPRRFLVR